MSSSFRSPADASALLAGTGYVADDDIATAVYLAQHLGKPLLLEGPAGVGKTQLAIATAEALGLELVRLQCYEGLDESRALYEWKYPKQLLYTQMLRDRIEAIVAGARDLREAIERIAAHEDAFFSERFLDPRPLLRAIRSPRPVVLLIDEVDRAEPELEAFFLELLGEFQVTIPELGTLTATHRPLVFLTSNDSRELSDALRRRCLHLGLDLPAREREAAIVRARVPGLAEELADAVTRFVSGLRELDLRKGPSIAETLDFARSLVLLRADALDREVVESTLSLLVKVRGDREVARDALGDLLEPERPVRG